MQAGMSNCEQTMLEPFLANATGIRVAQRRVNQRYEVRVIPGKDSPCRVGGAKMFGRKIYALSSCAPSQESSPKQINSIFSNTTALCVTETFLSVVGCGCNTPGAVVHAAFNCSGVAMVSVTSQLSKELHTASIAAAVQLWVGQLRSWQTCTSHTPVSASM